MARIEAGRAGRKGSGVFVAAMLAAIAVLVGLGIWQIQRGVWKSALLAELDSREAMQPIDLATLEPGDLSGVRYRRVAATGVFRPGLIRMHHVEEGALGYKAVLPFMQTEGDDMLLVDLGFVRSSMESEAAATVPDGVVRLEGYARLPTARPSVFTPDNAPAENRWFWWDLSAMTRTLDAANAAVLPVIIQLSDPVPGVRVAGLAPEPTVSLPRPHNRHAGYAVTWFGLALVVGGALVAWIWQRRPRPARNPPQSAA